MAQVKAVPDGYHTVTPFLSVNGARDAIAFYQQAFGAEQRGDAAAGPDGKIIHSEIQIGDSVVMVADAMMGPPTQASIHLYVQDVDAAWAKATAAGCQVVMPLENQFWGDRYGMLSDQWGNRWSLASHKEDLSPDEMKRRMDDAFKQMKP